MDWAKQQTKPFFIYLATTASHTPLYVEPRYAKPYEDFGEMFANLYGMTANLDENVGRLMQFLDESGLARNTIVIYMHDNGSDEKTGWFNGGMRGLSGSTYDGGHHAPFFIRWPAGLKGGPRDIIALTHGTDVLPTLIDLCELNVSRPAHFDGLSLKPLLDGLPDCRTPTIRRGRIATHARFTLPLKHGEHHHLEGQFLDAAGQVLCGAFFTHVALVHD